MSERLTERLLRLNPELLKAATTHRFLRDAGKGELTKEQLEAWLTQDRLYITGGYVQLIGALLQKITPTRQEPSHIASTGFSHKLNVITAALTNIERELRFFEQTAGENSLRLDKVPLVSGAIGSSVHAQCIPDLMHPTTQEYIDHIASVGRPDTLWSDAIILLWAMEIIYLKAWRFAASHRPTSASNENALGIETALDVLIENWTCSEFERFVDRLGALVDEISADYTGADHIWTQTLSLEIRFWETSQT